MADKKYLDYGGLADVACKINEVDAVANAGLATAVQANERLDNQTASSIPYQNATSCMTADDVQEAIDELKGSIDQIPRGIVPRGTIAFASLPSLASAEIGDMYNISDDFTTTSDFVVPGVNEKAGSNVYVADMGSNVKKWDVFAVAPDVVVDQTYDPTSTNPQSGTAIAGLESTLKQAICCKADYCNAKFVGSISMGRCSTSSVGGSSVATGEYVIAEGTNSHAEGNHTCARGNAAHAEGNDTVASCGSSHAEGSMSCTFASSSHAEGVCTRTYGDGSHTEGCGNVTCASACYAHVEGAGNTACGYASHVEGLCNTTRLDYSHVIGKYAVNDGNCLYVERVGWGDCDACRKNIRALDTLGNEYLKGDVYLCGNTTCGVNAKIGAINTCLSCKADVSSLCAVATSGCYCDLTGTPTLAAVATSGKYCDLQNVPTVDSAMCSTSTNAIMNCAVDDALSCKQDTLVSGTNIKTINGESLLGNGDIVLQTSLAPDADYIATDCDGCDIARTADTTVTCDSTCLVTSGAVYTGLAGKADCCNTVIEGSLSMGRKAGSTVGANSVALGSNVIATGIASHAEGYCTCATGSESHAEGYCTCASGNFSHAEGSGNTVYTSLGHVQGAYSVNDTSCQFVDIVGWGCCNSERKNIEATDKLGNKYLAGDVYVCATCCDATGGTPLGATLACKVDCSYIGCAAACNATNCVIDQSTELITSGGVKTAIEAAISSVYKPAGNKCVEDLDSTLLVAGNLGNVYNMENAGTTTCDFVEGAGKPINEGDNVSIVDVGTASSPDYKFDLMSGFIDTSEFIKTSTTAGLVKNDGTIDTCGYTTCTGTLTGVSLNGCSFTVNNGVASLTDFKPATAGTADNSTCFGGCTYTDAMADIRNYTPDFANCAYFIQRTSVSGSCNFDVSLVNNNTSVDDSILYVSSSCRLNYCNTTGHLCITNSGRTAIAGQVTASQFNGTLVGCHVGNVYAPNPSGTASKVCNVTVTAYCTSSTCGLATKTWTFRGNDGVLCGPAFMGTSYMIAPVIYSIYPSCNTTCNVKICARCCNTSGISEKAWTFCGSTGYMHGNVCGNLCGTATCALGAVNSTCFDGCTYACAKADIRSGLVSSISLNGSSFTVSGGAATLTGFKPATATTADTVCRNGYSSAYNFDVALTNNNCSAASECVYVSASCRLSYCNTTGHLCITNANRTAIAGTVSAENFYGNSFCAPVSTFNICNCAGSMTLSSYGCCFWQIVKNCCGSGYCYCTNGGSYNGGCMVFTGSIASIGVGSICNLIRMQSNEKGVYLNPIICTSAPTCLVDGMIWVC